ncbi:unnamed protein product [Peronospora destructor]|uniref:Gamma-glutamyltransferase n=1 Tax=Peronospora destructor TaxID=86335 RepID=A0AAV0V2H2_9STRA|nr:unnamed protein product [Peronospora destructor]
MVSIGSRSPVYSRHGMVSCSQPLASEIGVRILQKGGNAVDAAIAIAAALHVTEPCSTGQDATEIPNGHGHAVTVPGTVAGWMDAVAAWGTLSMKEILTPATEMAREGFPVSPLTASSWQRNKALLLPLREQFGHDIHEVTGLERSIFGRGQIILRDPKTGVLCAGSDGRADGCAIGW